MSSRKWVSAAFVALIATVASASVAKASTTIGQLAPGTLPPPTHCAPGPADLVQPTVASGPSYAVPEAGVAISSWSTFAAAGADQTLTLKVFRKVPVGDPFVWEVVGHDGPRPLAPGVVNTFQTNLAVQPGDLVGFNTQSGPGAQTACVFDTLGESLRERLGNLADGQNGTFGNESPNIRLNLTATVLVRPSNDAELGQVKRNKNRGTATIRVQVPGPGTLSLSGKGVKAQRAPRVGRATASKTVAVAGPVTLRVQAKGAKKRRLNRRGQVRVRANVVYLPSGDVPGEPKTLSHRIKLIKLD